MVKFHSKESEYIRRLEESNKDLREQNKDLREQIEYERETVHELVNIGIKLIHEKAKLQEKVKKLEKYGYAERQ